MKKKQPVKQTKSPARGTKKSPPKKTVKVGQIGGKSSRRFSKVHLLILVLVFAIIGAVYTFASHAATGDGSIGVYRLFQGAGNQHMFTTSEAETRSLVPAAGFSSEGFGFYAWTTANDGRKPVYRLASPGTNGKHLFTMSEVEKNALVKGGWTQEGIAFYAYDAASAGRIPAYRMSYANGDHLYTTSGYERDQLTKSGWSNEGVAFYVSDGASAPAQNTHQPSGALDASDCRKLVGWALDGDNLNVAVRVDAYVQGVGIASGATSADRPDITRIFYAPGAHGYIINIPDRWLDGQAHGADVYGINVNSKGEVGGANSQIGHREFACDKAGKDHMPEIQAQRAAAAAAAAKKAAEDAAKASQQTTSATPNWPSTPGAPTLSRGSTGLEVLGLQTKLGKVGFWLAADGNFGATTEWAVRAFQLEIGLPFNGTADGQTQEVLARALNDGWKFNPNDPLLSNIPPIGSVNPTPAPAPTPTPAPTTTPSTTQNQNPASIPSNLGYTPTTLGTCVIRYRDSAAFPPLIPRYRNEGTTTFDGCRTKAYFLRYTEPANIHYYYADWAIIWSNLTVTVWNE